MKKNCIVLFLATFATTGFSQEIKIAAKALPSAVVKAYRNSYPNAHISGATKETDKDGVHYEIMSKDTTGKRMTLTYNGNGMLLETETPMTIDQLPSTVTSAIEKQYPKGKILSIEMASKSQKVTYEVLIRVNKKKFEVIYAPDGSLVK